MVRKCSLKRAEAFAATWGVTLKINPDKPEYAPQRLFGSNSECWAEFSQI